MVAALMRGTGGQRLRAMTKEHVKIGDRHPLMMVVATRAVLPIAIVVGAFIFLRGHGEPGGGFIAGLVVAVAVLKQYMASGLEWAQARQRFAYHGMIAVGMLTAAATGIASWFFGYPFLKSTFGYVTIPPLSKFELASAMAFDVGVFLTVLGAVMLALAELSRMGVASDPDQPVNTDPMDIVTDGGTIRTATKDS